MVPYYVLVVFHVQFGTILTIGLMFMNKRVENGWSWGYEVLGPAI